MPKIKTNQNLVFCVYIFGQYTCKLTGHSSGTARLLPTPMPSCFSLFQKTTQKKLSSESLITATIFFGLLLLLFSFAFQTGEYLRLTQCASSIEVCLPAYFHTCLSGGGFLVFSYIWPIAHLSLAFRAQWGGSAERGGRFFQKGHDAKTGGTAWCP